MKHKNENGERLAEYHEDGHGATTALDGHRRRRPDPEAVAREVPRRSFDEPQ